MSHAYNKCKEEIMGKDNSEGCFADWPKPKKSKTDETFVIAQKWKYLPSVILHDIFSNLEVKDRINASSTCRMWRNSLYHPNFWQTVTFDIRPHTIPKVQYLRSVVGHLVTKATIEFNSMNSECVTEFLHLLQHLNVNDNLQSLIIRPSHSHIVLPPKETFKDGVSPIVSYLFSICNSHKPLVEISLGLNEELLQEATKYLELLGKLKPEKLTLLGWASIKDDPGNYLINYCDPALFMPFTKLKILSIDYDILNDGLLKSLKSASEMERLIIHVHGIWDGHPGTTDATWLEFRECHPKCLLRISLIHAFDEVNHLQDQILKCNMPLSHIKVLFCENLNLTALDVLARYSDTLTSVMWVDSMCHDDFSNSWNIIRYMEESDHMEPVAPDPFVILSWLCKKLEQIVLIGYKYHEEDLLAIARLRGRGLKELEVPYDDILVESGEEMNKKNIKEISWLLGRDWMPKKTDELHPVLKDPTAGDSDEYLIPILLSDLH